jgi:hypothetical protein
MTADRFARAVAGLAAAFWIVFGIWAFVDPSSFAHRIADFKPYNEHLFHDVGSFQIGLGAGLVLALLRWNSLAAALGGTAVGSVLHEISHIMDKDKGGKDTDPIGLGILAVLAVAAAIAARNAQGTKP